jgi:hypothetical protein
LQHCLANPIGSKVVSLAAGQYAKVGFDWVPVLVDQGHECLVAQVYDPVSDPVVAPFNPVQDRHVAQRNISVVQLPTGKALTFNFFSQNLALTQANTVLEVQNLQGEALKTLAASMGRDAWPAAGGVDVQLSSPVSITVQPSLYASQLATGIFRETLQDVPGPNEAKRVMGVLRSIVASRKTREGIGATPTPGEAAPVPPSEGAQLHEFDTTGARAADPGTPIRLAAGQHVRLSLRAALPTTSKRGSADVWRIVERTAGQITGGTTIVVQAK